MPNQPREGTSTHTFREDDTVWAAAQQKAAARGETVADVIRRALRRYIR